MIDDCQILVIFIQTDTFVILISKDCWERIKYKASLVKTKTNIALKYAHSHHFDNLS